MYKVAFLLAPLVVLIAAPAAQADTVYFDSGSAKVHSTRVAKHKQKVWVPAHRSKNGHRVKGHYVRR